MHVKYKLLPLPFFSTFLFHCLPSTNGYIISELRVNKVKPYMSPSNSSNWDFGVRSPLGCLECLHPNSSALLPCKTKVEQFIPKKHSLKVI